MSFATLLLGLAFFLSQDSGLTGFSFCRESPAAEPIAHCFELDGDGKGVFKFTPPDADTVEVPFEFSPRAAERFHELLRETDYLVEGESYESGRRVANMGTKTMTAEGPWGRREAVFNYSTVNEAVDLATFFDRLVSQELLLFDLDIALEFDRLGVPARLEQLEEEIRSDRLPDAGRVIAALERVESAPGLVNYARTTATRLKEELIEDAN